MADKNQNITTIKLLKDSKKRLDKLKIHNRETYDDVIQKILNILNILKLNPYQAQDKLGEIEAIRDKLNPHVKPKKVF